MIILTSYLSSANLRWNVFSESFPCLLCFRTTAFFRATTISMSWRIFAKLFLLLLPLLLLMLLLPLLLYLLIGVNLFGKLCNEIFSELIYRNSFDWIKVEHVGLKKRFNFTKHQNSQKPAEPLEIELSTENRKAPIMLVLNALLKPDTRGLTLAKVSSYSALMA